VRQRQLFRRQLACIDVCSKRILQLQHCSAQRFCNIIKWRFPAKSVD
jgi:hypothetical protein